METGIYKRFTSLRIFEGCKSSVPVVKRNMRKTKIKDWSVIERKFEGVKFEDEDIKPNVSFFNFDICGNICMNKAYTLYKNQHMLADRVKFPVTLKAISRKKHTEKAIKYACKNKINHYLLPEIKDMLSNFKEKDGGFLWVTDKIRHNIFIQLNALFISLCDFDFDIRAINHYKNNEKNSQATDMVFLDIVLTRKNKRDTELEEKLLKAARHYNKNVEYNSKIRGLEPKQKSTRKIVPNMTIKNAYDIAKKLNIFGVYKSYDQIPAAKRSWITMHAERTGLDPILTHDKIRNKLDKYGINV